MLSSHEFIFGYRPRRFIYRLQRAAYIKRLQRKWICSNSNQSMTQSNAPEALQ